LWTLRGLGELTDSDILAALGDIHAGVRENALRLAEEHIASNRVPARARDSKAGAETSSPAVVNALLNMTHDLADRVRFQLAFTLGELSDPRALDALGSIAKRDANDPWIRTAVLSSVTDTSDQLLQRLLADTRFIVTDAAATMIRDLAQIVGARGQTAEMQRAIASLRTAGDTPARREVITGIGEGLKRSGRSLRRASFTGDAAQVVTELLAAAARSASAAQAPIADRAAAVRLLAYDEFATVQPVLASLLEATQPQEIQRAAIATTGSFTAAETGPMLLQHWRAQTPALRAEVIVAMLGGRNRVLPLLQAIERGEIPANQIPFAKRATLLRSTDAKVKELATKLFSDSAPGARKEVVAKYQAALSLKGDAARGRIVFEAACATCHVVGNIGKDVGPNLATVRQWNPEQLLLNILDPNREVSPNFVSYTVETKDGRTLDGIIAEESAASLTLKRADGTTESVLRRDIASITGSGLSLMPEGVEASVTVEQMADLLAFLLGGNN
jgi:putative heme-binding domain-containing protein